MKWAAGAALALCVTGRAAAEDRILRAELAVEAPVAEVWRAWTTREGIQGFFAPDGRVDPRVDGLYEIYFNPGGAPGQRGADGMRILAFEPPHRLAFTWNAPADFPHARAQRTVVNLDLQPIGPVRTRLVFTHLGWGQGQEWDDAYDYFDQAWRVVVLPRLLYRFRSGPVDWKSLPTLDPVGSTIKAVLARAR
jgi:uncharacterized protein YndB with AHSA1/START domain